MSVGSSSMSLSDRAAPIARAIFFIWEEKSFSILVLRWTGAGWVGVRTGGALLGPSTVQLLPPKWGPQGPDQAPHCPSAAEGNWRGQPSSTLGAPGLADAPAPRALRKMSLSPTSC